MLTNLHQTNYVKEYELEYQNRVGMLFKNHIFLNDNNKILKFKIQEIKRLFLKKERNLKFNYVLLTVATCIFVLSLIFCGNSILYRFVGFGASSIIFLFAMAKKKYHYKIILFTQNSSYSTVNIDKVNIDNVNKENARKLLSLTRPKIKKTALS